MRDWRRLRSSGLWLMIQLWQTHLNTNPPYYPPLPPITHSLTYFDTIRGVFYHIISKNYLSSYQSRKNFFSVSFWHSWVSNPSPFLYMTICHIAWNYPPNRPFRKKKLDFSYIFLYIVSWKLCLIHDKNLLFTIIYEKKQHKSSVFLQKLARCGRENQ